MPVYEVLMDKLGVKLVNERTPARIVHALYCFRVIAQKSTDAVRFRVRAPDRMNDRWNGRALFVAQAFFAVPPVS